MIFHVWFHTLYHIIHENNLKHCKMIYDLIFIFYRKKQKSKTTHHYIWCKIVYYLKRTWISLRSLEKLKHPPTRPAERRAFPICQVWFCLVAPLSGELSAAVLLKVVKSWHISISQTGSPKNHEEQRLSPQHLVFMLPKQSFKLVLGPLGS